MSTLNLWQDPFADVEQLVRTVFASQPERPQGWTPASEVFRDGDDAVVQVELPGLDAGRDVAVEIDKGYLVIRGERRPPSDAQRRPGTVRERRYGAFRRVFRLPDHVSPTDLSASYDAGMLTVRVVGAYSPPKPVAVTITAAAPSREAPIEATSGSSAGGSPHAGPADGGAPQEEMAGSATA